MIALRTCRRQAGTLRPLAVLRFGGCGRCGSVKRTSYSPRRDESDAIAVRIGFRLRERYEPGELTSEVIFRAIWAELPAIAATGERKVLPQK